MLHITNGDHAVEVLAQAVQGDFLPWRDVLHEGPLRAVWSNEERAAFLSEAFGAEPRKVLGWFQERDAALGRIDEHDEVVLWFEHDLYDQLQLIQVLDWLGAHPHPKLSLVCEAEYLGQMQPSRAAQLFESRAPIAPAQLEEARAAWAALTAPDPLYLERVPCSHLRFLGAALRRHLEEFPWVSDGLSRTERAVLRSLPRDFRGIFVAIREDPAFMGDTVLAWHLGRLHAEGLIEKQGELWKAVPRPERKRVPRWLGGVRVTEDSPWRWDSARGAIRALR
jgi:hypothetical protein